MIGQLKDMNQLLSELLTAWDRDTASADGENEVGAEAEELEDGSDEETEIAAEELGEEVKASEMS